MAAQEDWMGEEELEASRARSAAEGPRCEDGGLYPDPEDTCSRPAGLDDETLAAMDAQAEADAAVEAAGVAPGDRGRVRVRVRAYGWDGSAARHPLGSCGRRSGRAWSWMRPRPRCCWPRPPRTPPARTASSPPSATMS